MQSATRKIRNGIIASFVATVVLSAIMVMKQKMGLMPEMNPIADLAMVAHGFLGTPAEPVVGWLLHFAIGTIAWGVLYALLYSRLPGSNLIKGLSFGIIAWLLMMFIFMPVSGAGIFGLKVGVAVPVMSLVFHLVFGAVLGIFFGKLNTK